MATIEARKTAGVSPDTSVSTDFNSEATITGNCLQNRQKSNNSISGAKGQRNQGATSDDDQGDDEEEEEDNNPDEADGKDSSKKATPTNGFGIGIGKRPAICEKSAKKGSENSGTVLGSESLSTASSKKRDASIFTTVDDEEEAFNDDEGQGSSCYPRKKMVRRLSNASNGMMAYEDARKDSIASEEGALGGTAPSAVEETSDDDEIYNKVAEIDESDNDEVLSEAAEERMLKKDFELSDNESEEGDGPDMSLLLDNNSLFRDDYLTMHTMDDNLLGLSSDHWRGMEEIAPVQSNTSTRRVRFDDHVHAVSDVDSDTSSEDLNSFFPDLFHRESQLLTSANFHPDGVLDEAGYFEGSTASDSEKSYWDFGDEKPGEWRDHDVHTESESESDSEAGSSGYETDEGDTTDEELPPPPTISKPSRVHRDSESSASTSTATPKPFPRNKKARSNKRNGPVRGFFTLDPKRPIAFVDSTGTRMVLLPARTPDKENPLWPGSTASSTANNSPRSSFQMLNGEESDFSDGTNRNLVDIMLSGVSGAFGGNNFPIGPPEAFFPFVDVQLDGTIVADDEYDEDEMDEGENLLDVHDFIDFGEGETDEGDDETDVPTAGNSPTTVNAGHTPARPSGLSAAQEMSRNMLQHFDRGVVTSFRRNQNRYRDVARLPDDPAMRASASRPVRTGASADAIITPMRKKKSESKTMGRGSPLARKSGQVAGFSSRRR
ncbi:uncharacterized protein K452DRAFT_305959 [Aplosporella prunicola CBS 121167]|uniref:Uncharacterized protein n=1 Tax=Aplosporella prunicola CBS 121167 TaxID=1176127 RepID=A0A6A6BP23_9PEZI|nr:uncharacterized protein K452DRAFT_305959 [Aplosporella prunicola CBS 121167]KAF2145015.1 hypothetical protein K452DRAFT_305959 [Aplosporella prunicola CBS 121167]